jgi:amidohydrolase
MKDLLTTIKQNSFEIFEIVKSYHRTIHSNPELSFKENHTAKFIYEQLKSNNIAVYDGIGGTGIIGIVDSNKPGKTIGIRAELDALPINETTNLEFISKNSGAMHACGHDIHMASLLGTAILLNKLKDQLTGKVLLIFEPGEEQIPGGATEIIKSPIFQANFPNVMLTFHVLPELIAGKAGFCEGRYMASGDEIYITVMGKGGHAALPKTYNSPLIIASNLLIKLQEFINTNTPTEIPTVLAFGKIQGNGATNIIPNEVFLEGTFRTMDEEWRKNAHLQINEFSKKVCQDLGGDCEVEIRKGYPSVFNDPELTSQLKEYAAEYLGYQNIITLEKRMTTDDFAYFSQIVPSVFFRMGVGFDENTKYQLHNPSFIANEDVLRYSPGLVTWIIFKLAS